MIPSIPGQLLVPYLGSNLVALILLGLAFRRPQWVRRAAFVLFIWAAWTNARTAINHPEAYQGYADLTFLPAYRTFITGWFRLHTRALVLPIAVGQLAIALLLFGGPPLRRLGVYGAVVFLLAIAPLGVGSAFPFSLICALALILMDRRLTN